MIVPLHRGELFGWPGMVLAASGCVGALVLVYTGFALSWRRLIRPMLKRKSRPATIPDEVTIAPAEQLANSG